MMKMLKAQGARTKKLTLEAIQKQYLQIYQNLLAKEKLMRRKAYKA